FCRPRLVRHKTTRPRRNNRRAFEARNWASTRSARCCHGRCLPPHPASRVRCPSDGLRSCREVWSTFVSRGHLVFRQAKQERDAAGSFGVIPVEFLRRRWLVLRFLFEQAAEPGFRHGCGHGRGCLPFVECELPRFLELLDHVLRGYLRDRGGGWCHYLHVGDRSGQRRVFARSRCPSATGALITAAWGSRRRRRPSPRAHIAHTPL